MSKLDVSVKIGALTMKNPVTVSSGTFGYGAEYAELIDVNRLGAITVKGIRLTEVRGNPLPRMVEVHGGLLNAIGLQGPGVDGFVETYMPFLREVEPPVIVNIWGTTVEEYAEVAARFDDVEGVDALEVNISCPNVKKGGIAFGTDPVMASDLVARVRAKTKLPVIPKLAPNVPDIRVFVRAVEEAGADAISLVNTMPAMVIDTETRKPALANVSGGLSGPAIHPIAVKLVFEAAQVTQLPIMAMGGVTDADTAIEFLIAGATAVAVGTANFTEPSTAISVVDGIEAYLQAHALSSVQELIGSVIC